MSNEDNNSHPWDFEEGWFSEPNVEFVIDPNYKKKGIIERVKSFLMLFF